MLDEKEKEQIIENRKKAKRSYQSLFYYISDILFRHDPAEIGFGFNPDEYEPEAGTIVPKLKDCHSSEDVLLVVQEELQRWFCEEIALKEQNKEIAEEIWKVWRDKVYLR